MMVSTRPTAWRSPPMAAATNSSGTSVVSLIAACCASVTWHRRCRPIVETDHGAWRSAPRGYPSTVAVTPDRTGRGSRSRAPRPRSEGRPTRSTARGRGRSGHDDAPGRRPDPGRARQEGCLGDQPAPETVCDRLCAVADTELAEQPSRVGLDGVLGQVELAADLAVALALAHPAQDLQLALGQLDTGIGGGAGGRNRG